MASRLPRWSYRMPPSSTHCLQLPALRRSPRPRPPLSRRFLLRSPRRRPRPCLRFPLLWFPPRFLLAPRCPLLALRFLPLVRHPRPAVPPLPSILPERRAPGRGMPRIRPQSRASFPTRRPSHRRRRRSSHCRPLLRKQLARSRAARIGDTASPLPEIPGLAAGCPLNQAARPAQARFHAKCDTTPRGKRRGQRTQRAPR